MWIGGAASPPHHFKAQLVLLGGIYFGQMFCFKNQSKNQQNEIQDYFINEATTESTSEAIDYFDHEYEEDEIRLMKIKIFSDLAN